MDLNTRCSIVKPSVMSSQVGDEIVLLDMQNGIYFGIQGSGCRIWALIDQGLTIGQIVDALSEEFDGFSDPNSKDSLLGEVTHFVQCLIDSKLVRLAK